MKRGILILALALTACNACRDAPPPVGPPRCEPPEELVIERGLKEGFRALAEGEDEAARGAFEEVLALESEHPEARAGLRQVRSPRSEAPRRERSDAGPHGRIVLAGQEVRVAIPVDATRFRTEELRTQRRLGREMDLPGHERAVPDYFTERSTPSGSPVPPDDRAAVEARIDLVVLHASRSRTARESFLRLGATGGSTHFTIAHDGTVFQNLDLAWEANHSGEDAIDARSVSIDLVNPVTLDRPALPEGADSERHRRPLSEFVEIHGEEVQQWGYTAAQTDAVGRLVRELVRVLPGLPGELPGRGSVPLTVLPDRGRDFRGILGHLHLSPRALDPGPGFDWESLRAALGGG